MLKKALFLILSISIITFSAEAMQIMAIQHATESVLKEYRINVLRLKKAEKSHPELFAKVEPVLAKIVNSDAFQTKVTQLVTEQYSSIVDQNGSFTPLQQDFYLSDYVSSDTTKMHKYMSVLFVVMARKEYYKKLWQQLSKKSKELTSQFEKVEKELGQQQEIAITL